MRKAGVRLPQGGVNKETLVLAVFWSYKPEDIFDKAAVT